MALTWSYFVLFLGIMLLVKGQQSTKFYDDSALDYSDYKNDYTNNGINIDSPEDDFRLPIRTSQLQKFMNALVMEAGRHVLYPPKETMKRRSQSFNKGWDKSRGEPEYIDLGNRRSQRELLDCPDKCPLYSPVCANNGKVYDSECHLLRDNCGISNITVTNWEECRGRHYLCPSKCMAINDPVCGEDGKIYANICVMRKRNCGQLLATRRIKHCYVRSQEPSEYESCPEDCKEIYKPACGSDGRIYYNECFLRMKNCGTNIEAVDINACTEVSECPERCIPIYDPVCGSDRKIYTNICRMLQDNCGIEIKRMPKSFCHKRG